MLSYTLKVSLCWALFYLLYHLWLSKETLFKVNRWYLLGTTILGLIIPLIDFQWFVSRPETPAIVHYLQPISVGVNQLETVVVMASSGQAAFNWWGLLIKIYWAGVLVSFIRLLFGLFKINQLYTQGEKSNLLHYQLVTTAGHHAPFSFFKNLFWSKSFEVDEEDKRNIIRHEEAHIFQYHSIDVLLFEIAGILFWCSPLIYFYKKSIKDTHEFLADDYVVAQASRKKYGRLLLRQSQSGMPIAISNSLFSSQLKNRIVMMTKKRSTKKASLKYLAGLPVIALLFLAFSFEQHPDGAENRIHPVFKKQIANDTLPGDEIFKVVEEMPLFAGSWELSDDPKEQQEISKKKMLEFIYMNLKYPKAAREKNIQGMVVARFIVEKDGRTSNVEIIRKIGGGCDEEVVRVVEEMPLWKPGKQRGKDVRVQYNLPVKFKLDTDAPNKKAPLQEDAGVSTDDLEETFKVVEEMPQYPGCEAITNKDEQTACAQKKMLEFIYSNIKYPADARKKGIEGMAVVQFVIEKDGSIADAEIIRSIGGGCDEEVLKVVYMMPNWIPGKQAGKVVRTQFNLPVRFKLESGTSGSKTLNIDDVDQLPYMASCKDVEKEDRKTCSDKALVNSVYRNVKYPISAKADKLEGVVVAQFVIEKDGAVTQAKIIKSLGGGCDEEVLRVVSEMPNWIPGMKDGHPVAVEFKLPVKFKLSSEDNDTNESDASNSVNLKAFPNPTSDKLSLEFEASPGDYKITLTDANGKVHFNKDIDAHDGKKYNIVDLPVDHINRGTLYVTVSDKDGKTIQSTTVILQ